MYDINGIAENVKIMFWNLLLLATKANNNNKNSRVFLLAF